MNKEEKLKAFKAKVVLAYLTGAMTAMVNEAGNTQNLRRARREPL